MSTTFEADHGSALASIIAEAIQKGPVDPIFNNCCGEERLWFGPEGSQYGLHFRSSVQTFDNYSVPLGMNLQGYNVLACDSDALLIRGRLRLQNSVGTWFDFEVERTIRIVTSRSYMIGLGEHIKFIGFQSESRITDPSPRQIFFEAGMSRSWAQGLHPCRGGAVVVVLFREGVDREWEPPVRRDYFKDLGGDLPADRWSTNKRRVIFKVNGEFRLKPGVSARRALNRIGASNPQGGTVVIHDFDWCSELNYLAPHWADPTPEELAHGEVPSAYTGGSDESGKRTGDFYQLETLSSAIPLVAGESFVHRNRVLQLPGTRDAVNSLSPTFLHTTFEEAAGVLERSANEVEPEIPMLV
jgi:hypothetical protein